MCLLLVNQGLMRVCSVKSPESFSLTEPENLYGTLTGMEVNSSYKLVEDPRWWAEPGIKSRWRYHFRCREGLGEANSLLFF